MTPPGSEDRPGAIGRNDIERKLREIRGEVEAIETSAKPYLLAVGAAAAVAVVALAFALGKRRGKHKRTVVEIRRV
jgi:hypothetical protein